MFMITVALRKSKYAKLYEWFLDDVQDRHGISIIHRKLKDSFAHYDTKKRVITVDNNIAGTVFGIFIVAHETCHILDEINGLYPDFYSKILYGETKGIDVEKVVWSAEWHCCKEAIKTLEKLGIDSYNQFCDKNWVKRYILPVWVSYYSK